MILLDMLFEKFFWNNKQKEILDRAWEQELELISSILETTREALKMHSDSSTGWHKPNEKHRDTGLKLDRHYNNFRWRNTPRIPRVSYYRKR